MNARSWLALAALAGILAGCGGVDDERTADVARRYAEALSTGSSTALAAVTCVRPTAEQARAFEERAGGGRLRWTVHARPEVDGERADGTLRASEAGVHKDFSFTLRRRGEQWCAHYDWAAVLHP